MIFFLCATDPGLSIVGLSEAEHGQKNQKNQSSPAPSTLSPFPHPSRLDVCCQFHIQLSVIYLTKICLFNNLPRNDRTRKRISGINGWSCKLEAEGCRKTGSIDCRILGKRVEPVTATIGHTDTNLCAQGSQTWTTTVAE